jgi:hypothetical protein
LRGRSGEGEFSATKYPLTPDPLPMGEGFKLPPYPNEDRMGRGEKKILYN